MGLEYTELGRTGMRVSVAGLGCGGHSRLGQSYGASESESIAVVHRALELGINFIDTAAAYGTEPIVGKAVRGCRDQIVLSTKAHPRTRGGPATKADLARFLESTLRRLGTDYVDVYHLHGVGADEYAYCRDELVPALLQLKQAGKIRWLGITERFGGDTAHTMFARALPDDLFDVAMVGYNLLNPSAAKTIFPRFVEKRVGSLIMFAVRRALSRPDVLAPLVRELVAAGEVPTDVLEASDPLAFLVREFGAESVVDAAYRFCRHTRGADVILTGTGKIAHLEENVASILRPPLPAEALARLDHAFGKVSSVSGN